MLLVDSFNDTRIAQFETDTYDIREFLNHDDTILDLKSGVLYQVEDYHKKVTISEVLNVDIRKVADDVVINFGTLPTKTLVTEFAGDYKVIFVSGQPDYYIWKDGKCLYGTTDGFIVNTGGNICMLTDFCKPLRNTKHYIIPALLESYLYDSNSEKQISLSGLKCAVLLQ